MNTTVPGTAFEVQLSELQDISNKIAEYQKHIRDLMARKEVLLKNVKGKIKEQKTGNGINEKLFSFIEAFMRTRNGYVSIKEICMALEKANADFIPTHVIHLNAYVQRRINIGVELSRFVRISTDNGIKDHYALPGAMAAYAR